jgi:hypothetical protein
LVSKQVLLMVEEIILNNIPAIKLVPINGGYIDNPRIAPLRISSVNQHSYLCNYFEDTDIYGHTPCVCVMNPYGNIFKITTGKCGPEIIYTISDNSFSITFFQVAKCHNNVRFGLISSGEYFLRTEKYIYHTINKSEADRMFAIFIAWIKEWIPICPILGSLDKLNNHPLCNIYYQKNSTVRKNTVYPTLTWMVLNILGNLAWEKI